MDFLKDFGVQPVLLAAQVVNFLILLFILKRFLYGPLLKVLATRRQKIEESLKNAQEIEKRLLEITKKEEAVLSKAFLEGEKLIAEASMQSTQIVEEAKGEAEEIILLADEEAKGIINIERAKLASEFRGNLVNMVGLVVQKITGKVINKKDQVDILEKEIKNLS